MGRAPGRDGPPQLQPSWSCAVGCFWFFMNFLNGLHFWSGPSLGSWWARAVLACSGQYNGGIFVFLWATHTIWAKQSNGLRFNSWAAHNFKSEFFLNVANGHWANLCLWTDICIFLWAKIMNFIRHIL
jgi:hypothetical protein